MQYSHRDTMYKSYRSNCEKVTVSEVLAREYNGEADRNDFLSPVLHVPEWESSDDVPHPILSEWESEQTKMKRKVITSDCPEVQQFVKLFQDGHFDADKGADQKKFYVGGVDISFVIGDPINACAALVVIEFPSLKTVYTDMEMVKLTLPYIPGFLGFREVPHIAKLFQKLKKTKPEYYPQVVMVDGNGILHTRRFGSACHLGVTLDLPTIGVAKKLFHVDGLEKNGAHQQKIQELDDGGDSFPLVGESGETLGRALRGNNGSRIPVYVSTGHKISLETAVELVHRCCKHRIPEPVRLADINSREFIRVNFQPEHADNKRKRQDSTEAEVKPWTALDHCGPLFPPEYEPLPDEIKLQYSGEPVRLSGEAEEAAVNYCKILVRGDCLSVSFKSNFLKSWRELMTEEEKKMIMDLEKCDFGQICEHVEEQKQKHKQMSPDEKKILKLQNKDIAALHGRCILNGKKEKVMNFKISPPCISEKEGSSGGLVLRRIEAEDVVINITDSSHIPDPPSGHKWKEVCHNKGEFWLAQWWDPVNQQTVFMRPVCYQNNCLGAKEEQSRVKPSP